MGTTLGSLPSQGAWIEIVWSFRATPTPPSLPSQGAWIEICPRDYLAQAETSRSPHRGRGLKSRYIGSIIADYRSLPSQGAWIEIIHIAPTIKRGRVAPLTGGVD